MPLIKSAKKAVKTSLRQKEENDLTRAKVKNAVKGFKIALANKNKEATELLGKAFRELDIAAKKNVIHKNKASRIKSRLTKALGKIDEIAPVKAKTKKVAVNKKAATKK